MEVVNKILSAPLSESKEKEIEVEIDEGTLLLSDYNALDLKTDKESNLQATTRDNVQLLVNKVWSLPTKCVEEVIVAELPKPNYLLPRARKLPKPKPLTKWQQFAKEKGIRTKKKGRSKLKWDEQLQKWIPNFGFKRAQADKQKEWLIECGEDGTPREDPREALKTAKKEKVAKNELQRLRNLAKKKNIKVPKVGLPSTEHFRDAKQLDVGAKVADVSTASMGRFNENPKKDALRKTKGGKVSKKKKKKSGQMKESTPKTSKKPKAGKGNRDFRRKVGGRKRRK
ncbi:ribosome biogenesis regulatory protein homolog [Copidosoma floridanum]|uniref:ribosome biogenesis regulatory protein homolog n=1 Tax=Copidosoma floridanum TaxID=29053 RepID=UPI0006C9E293|nr:ribosome biogenesis regulatory protein homolog [Copidosoma floridanum]